MVFSTELHHTLVIYLPAALQEARSEAVGVFRAFMTTAQQELVQRQAATELPEAEPKVGASASMKKHKYCGVTSRAQVPPPGHNVDGDE